MIKINGYDVPEPIRQQPNPGDYVFTPVLERGIAARSFRWNGASEAHQWALLSGLCHVTRESAEWHAEALLSLTARNGE